MASLRRQSLSVAALAALLGGACTALPPAATPRAVQGRPLPACLQITIASTADHRPAGQLLLRLEAKQRRTSEGLMGIATMLGIDTSLSQDYVARARAASALPEGAASTYSPTWGVWKEFPGQGTLLLRWGAGTYQEALTMTPQDGVLRGETMLLGWPYDAGSHWGPDWAAAMATVIECPAS